MIKSKPQKYQWMPCPKIDTEYPGLTYIYLLDEVIIAKESDALHDIISKEGVRYTIFNNQQQKVFLGVQESIKKHNLKIFNYYGNEVIQIQKLRNICFNRILVFAPPGNFVGSVEERFPCLNIFLVKNCNGHVVLKLKARKYVHFEYDILSDDAQVGMIAKSWNKMNFSQKKNVGVSFPTEMDVGCKSVLIGACFLIGFLK